MHMMYALLLASFRFIKLRIPIVNHLSEKNSRKISLIYAPRPFQVSNYDLIIYT